MPVDLNLGPRRGRAAAGARAYLTKPLDVKHFLEVVDEILTETMP